MGGFLTAESMQAVVVVVAPAPSLRLAALLRAILAAAEEVAEEEVEVAEEVVAEEVVGALPHCHPPARSSQRRLPPSQKPLTVRRIRQYHRSRQPTSQNIHCT
jgi:hypothetical protein